MSVVTPGARAAAASFAALPRRGVRLVTCGVLKTAGELAQWRSCSRHSAKG